MKTVTNKNKNVPNSSMEDLANSLMDKLDRSKVFPPFYNNPEELINPSKIRSVGPPRPPNGFLLCRKNVHRQARERGVCNMRVISKVTGMLWRGASTDEKEQYENLAFQVQSLHSKRYPNYKYKPTSRAKIHPTLYQPYPIPQHQILPFSANQIGPIIPPYALPDMFYNNSDGMIMQDDVNLYNNMYMPCL
ncbi:hypothetical protein RclHR1_13720007 [Rhizophagus clarus]|uniref:HMG box domain-containing protein n=1 Tax=Rhizophagus clarus TaxID=94130 RepID=A0A2Z6QNB0_9GLOM|nr:hypothetical protein RclHR1_13720007 [Rhizophagus clarus]